MAVLRYWENMRFPQSLSPRARCQGVLEADMQVITGSLVIPCAMTLFVKIFEISTRYVTLKACRINYEKKTGKGSG